MIPDPKFGEIEIRGERWRWVTVEHFAGTAGGVADSRMRWSVSFRDPADPDRRFWCAVPARKAERLTDRELRELFEEARAAVH